MKRSIFKNFLTFSFLLIIFTSLFSCIKDEEPTIKPPSKPEANFVFAADTETGLNVSFTNISEFAKSHAWDFGVTGATSTAISPQYVYTAEGTYTVTLVVTSADGSVSTKSKIIEVKAPVSVDLNLVKNGNFVNADNWTLSDGVLAGEDWTGASDLTYNNGLTIKSIYVDGDGNPTSAFFSIYQAVDLAVGSYEIRSNVSIANMGSAWLSLSILDFALDAAAGEVVPEDDAVGANQVFSSDFGGDCTNFIGDLADMTCINDRFGMEGVKADGTFEITRSGTYYFVISPGHSESNFGDFKINNIGIYKK